MPLRPCRFPLPLAIASVALLAAAPLARALDVEPAPPSALPTTVIRQIGLDRAGCAVSKARFADDGSYLAMTVSCSAGAAGRRVWIVQLATGTVAPATPALGEGDPNSEAVVDDGTALQWAGHTLHVATTMATKGRAAGDPDYWSRRYFSVVPGQPPQPLKQLPAAIRAQLEHPLGQYTGSDALARTEDDAVDDGIFQLGRRMVWLANTAGGEMYLRTRSGTGAATTLARGHLELTSLQFDAQRLLYPVGNGIRSFDLETGTGYRVAGSSAGSLPIAWLPAARKLAFVSQRGCSGTARAGAPALCIATLPR